MARSKKKKSDRIVSLDFTDVDSGGGGFRIKEDNYRMKVVEVEQKESDAGNDMFVWTFEGTEGAAEGKKFKVYTTLNEEALWKLRSLLEALGVEIPDGPMDLDLDEMVDLELIGIVTDDTYQGKTVSRMNDFEAVEEDDDDSDDDKKSSKKKGKKTGKDDDKKSSKKKKELEKISEEEVRGMDADELEDLIKKYDLEVDLDDHKTLKRKISAVVSELEEKELIEEDDE